MPPSLTSIWGEMAQSRNVRSLIYGTLTVILLRNAVAHWRTALRSSSREFAIVTTVATNVSGTVHHGELFRAREILLAWLTMLTCHSRPTMLYLKFFFLQRVRRWPAYLDLTGDRI